MPLFRQIGVIVLLLLLAFAPAIACASPYAQLTPAEQACCHAMHFQCGQTAMPASHGCCQRTSPSVHDNALDTKAVAFHPAMVPVIWLAAWALVNPAPAVIGWVEHSDYSPPKSPPATISILRI